MDNVEYLNRGLDYPFDEDDFLDMADCGNVVAQYSLGLLYLEDNVAPDAFTKAIYWLECSATQGYVNAQLTLADSFYEGIYCEPNFSIAFRWYLRAACNGSAYAQAQVAYMYEFGEGVEADKEQSLRFSQLAADNQCPESQYLLFVENCASDDEAAQDKALEYLVSSASAGYPDALFELAQMHLSGNDVELDINASKTLLRKAAGEGHNPSKHLLATILLDTKGPGEVDEALKLLSEASEEEHTASMNLLAQLLEIGELVNKDEIAALSLILRASILKDTDAAYNRARLFLEGKIVTCNFEEGIKWLEQAASDSHALAQYRLGCAYKRGSYGLPKDLVLAEYWLTRSAENNVESLTELADTLLKASSCVENTNRAVACYRKALKAGNLHAGIILSQMYFEGNRVERDVKKSIYYLKVISHSHDPDVSKYACLTLGHIYNFGTGVPKNPKEALKWYCESSDRGSDEGTAQLAIMFAKGIGVKRNHLLATALQEKTDIDVDGVPSTKNLTPEAMEALDTLVHSLWKTKSTKRTISNFLMSNVSRINPLKRSTIKK